MGVCVYTPMGGVAFLRVALFTYANFSVTRNVASSVDVYNDIARVL